MAACHSCITCTTRHQQVCTLGDACRCLTCALIGSREGNAGNSAPVLCGVRAWMKGRKLNRQQCASVVWGAHLDEGQELEQALSLGEFVVLAVRHEALRAEGPRVLVHVVSGLQQVCACASEHDIRGACSRVSSVTHPCGDPFSTFKAEGNPRRSAFQLRLDAPAAPCSS